MEQIQISVNPRWQIESLSDLRSHCQAKSDPIVVCPVHDLWLCDCGLYANPGSNPYMYPDMYYNST